MKISQSMARLCLVTLLSACGGGGNDHDLSKLTCDSFGTQAAAQAAYNQGARQLDADGDGKACDNLK